MKRKIPNSKLQVSYPNLQTITYKVPDRMQDLDQVPELLAPERMQDLDQVPELLAPIGWKPFFSVDMERDI